MCFEGAQVASRQVQVQRLPAPPPLLLPDAVLPAQVAWDPCIWAVGFDEGQVVGPAQHLAVDLARRHWHRMRAEFVVEGEACSSTWRPQRPVTTRQRQRPGGSNRLRLPARVSHRNAQGLRHVQRGFMVHVFVEQAQAVEVQAVVVFRAGQKQVEALRQAIRQVCPCGLRTWQRQIPAGGLCDVAGVVQRVGVAPHGGQAQCEGVGRSAAQALGVAPDPVRLEPADVPQFPQRRVQLHALRHHKIPRCQRGFKEIEGGQGVAARGLQGLPQHVGTRLPDGLALVSDPVHSR